MSFKLNLIIMSNNIVFSFQFNVKINYTQHSISKTVILLIGCLICYRYRYHLNNDNYEY